MFDLRHKLPHLQISFLEKYSSPRRDTTFDILLSPRSVRNENFCRLIYIAKNRSLVSNSDPNVKRSELILKN